VLLLAQDVLRVIFACSTQAGAAEIELVGLIVSALECPKPFVAHLGGRPDLLTIESVSLGLCVLSILLQIASDIFKHVRRNLHSLFAMSV
jgi:hypothetical protein